MKATRKTEWVVPAAASATLVGAALSVPVLSLGAAAIAAIAVLRRRPASNLALVRAGRPAGALDLADLSKPLMLQGFGRRDSGSTASKPDAESETGPKRSRPRDPERGSRSYREFAAGLDDEPEEISFLPPYASDNASSAASDGASQTRDSSGESLLVGDLSDVDGGAGKMPVPRRFALGTVAIIRRLLEPADVERILIEQRRYPRLRFGDVAVQLNLLSESEVQELLVAQEQGIFSDEEISDARRRLASYHNGN